MPPEKTPATEQAKTPKSNAPEQAAYTGTMQLICNAAGHHVGETFKHDDAVALGILEHCRPFNPGK